MKLLARYGLPATAVIAFAADNVSLGVASIIVWTLWKAVNKLEAFSKQGDKGKNWALLNEILRIFK